MLATALLAATLPVTSAAADEPGWEVVTRVNAGGPAIGDFEADLRHSPSDALRGAGQAATWSSVVRGPTTPADVPLDVFLTERWDGDDADNMHWRWITGDGTYRVRLHFAEQYGPTQQVGARTYDVWSEHEKVLEDHDVHALAGGGTTLTEEYTVEVTDGRLNITFVPETQNPRVMAIEVFRRVGDDPTPTPEPDPVPVPVPVPDPDPLPDPAPEPDPDPDPEPDPDPDPEPAPEPEPEPVGACDGVRIRTTDDWDAVLAAHPAGTTYCVDAGVHRLVQVVPEHGDRFVGAGMGRTIVSGAKDLSAGTVTWQHSNGRWYVDGQDQELEGITNCRGGYCALVPGGNWHHLRGEELFVDDERWDEVGSTWELDRPGEWFLDRAANRIWIHADPRTLGRIEASARTGAFGGNGVRDVVISDMTLEKYGTVAQFGAVGWFREHATHDWTLRDVEARWNAAGGITIGPGMTIDGCHVHHNGQIGIVGNGRDTMTGSGYQAPVTIRDCEISHSPELDFDWGWEAGATKFKHVEGGVFERNHVHHAPVGVWFDVFNGSATIRDNLVEDISDRGIFYEISRGPALIERNMVRRVGDHTPASWDDIETWHGVFGIVASNSNEVTIRGNSVEDSGNGIAFVDKGRGNIATYGQTNSVVEGNDVHLVERPGGAGYVGFADVAAQYKDNVFRHNTYRTDGDLRVFRHDGFRIDGDAWRQRAEPTAVLVRDGSRPTWPVGYRGPRD